MDIILDTNIIRSNFRLTSDEFAVLLDYVERTDSRIILPDIVYKEVRSQYEKQLREHLNAFLGARINLQKTAIGLSLPELSFTVAEEVDKYLRYLLHKLSIDEEELVPLRPEYLEEVVRRAIFKVPPCSSKGEEFRDTLIWLCLLDVARSNNKSSVAFISANTTEFGKQGLKPELAAEVAGEGLSVLYFTSLGEFIKAHSSNNQKYNDEWFERTVDITQIEELLTRHLILDSDWLLEFAKHKIDQLTGYVNPIRSSLRLSSDGFYVYELSDGSLFVELFCEGEAEVEFEFEKSERQESIEYEWIWDRGSKYIPVSREGMRREIQYKTLTPYINLVASATIRNGTIENCDIKFWDFG